MNEQEETDRVADDDLILSAASMGLEVPRVLLPAQYEALADLEIEDIKSKSRVLGNGLSDVDESWLRTVRDTYKHYIKLQDLIGDNYTEEGKFGPKEHHLLKAYQIQHRIMQDHYKKLGFTPDARRLMDIVPTSKVPHGNAKSTSIMDIINE